MRWKTSRISNKLKVGRAKPSYRLSDISKLGWYNFNITPLVKEWLKYARGEGGYTYYRGFALKSSATGVSSKHFCSANYSGSLTPSITITYNETLTFNLGEIGNVAVSGIYYTRTPAWGKYITCDLNLYSFTVPETATYEISTMQRHLANGLAAAATTDINLYSVSSNGNLTYKVATQTYTSDSYYLSRKRWTLTPGTYCIYVFNPNAAARTTTTYVFIDTVAANSSVYINDSYKYRLRNLTYEFYIHGPQNPYNCYAFVLNEFSEDITDWDFGEANYYVDVFKGEGYTASGWLTNNCVIVYKDSATGNITHFARTINGVVFAKDGTGFLLKHANYNAYFPSHPYGTPYQYYNIP